MIDYVIRGHNVDAYSSITVVRLGEAVCTACYAPLYGSRSAMTARCRSCLRIGHPQCMGNDQWVYLCPECMEDR